MDFDILSEKIKNRYSKESNNSCNLSCGSNINYLNIVEGENILDLGCGNGLETIEASLCSGKNGFAVGLDITPRMLDAALENAKSKDVSNVKFICGDIENLPFNSSTFHAVMSNCVINHSKNKSKVYTEIYRVLKNGGRFVVSDAMSKEKLPPEIKNNPDAIAQCFGGAVTEDEYLKIIHSVGFSDIKILSRREYLKNGYDFVSLTIKAFK